LKQSRFASVLSGLPQGAEILIIRLRGLGDLVLLTPALAAVHAWRPDLRLSVLVEEGFAAVFDGNPAVAEVLLFRGFLRTARELRQRRFPITFNQHGGSTSALLTAAAGSRLRVCWENRRFGFIYNVVVPETGVLEGRSRLHTAEHRLLPFYWTGLPAGPIPPARVFPQPDPAVVVAQKLQRSGIAAGTPYCVLHPGTEFFTKRWPLEGYAEIAGWLRECHGLAPVVVLGPGDREIAAATKRRMAGAAPVLDSLPLRELIALIARARLFLGNDSGPAHLAAACGRPVVVIFGSSDSVVWRPWQTAHRVVQNDFACNPCPGDRCYAFGEPRCILSITPEQVREACDSLLAETDSHPLVKPQQTR